MVIFKFFKRIGNRKMKFSRQKIVMKITKDTPKSFVIIFGSELDIGRTVCIFQDEIEKNKITDICSLFDKYKTIIRRLKYIFSIHNHQ